MMKFLSNLMRLRQKSGNLQASDPLTAYYAAMATLTPMPIREVDLIPVASLEFRIGSVTVRLPNYLGANGRYYVIVGDDRTIIEEARFMEAARRFLNTVA